VLVFRYGGCSATSGWTLTFGAVSLRQGGYADDDRL
jgi:hypothetical protein